MRNCSKEIDMMIEEREKKLDQKLGEELPNKEESKEKKNKKLICLYFSIFPYDSSLSSRPFFL